MSQSKNRLVLATAGRRCDYPIEVISNVCVNSRLHIRDNGIASRATNRSYSKNRPCFGLDFIFKNFVRDENYLARCVARV